MWIACFDVDAGNAAAAQELYATAGMSLPPGFVSPIIAALSHKHADVRAAAAAALAAAMQVLPYAPHTPACQCRSNHALTHVCFVCMLCRSTQTAPVRRSIGSFPGTVRAHPRQRAAALRWRLKHARRGWGRSRCQPRWTSCSHAAWPMRTTTCARRWWPQVWLHALLRLLLH